MEYDLAYALICGGTYAGHTYPKAIGLGEAPYEAARDDVAARVYIFDTTDESLVYQFYAGEILEIYTMDYMDNHPELEFRFIPSDFYTEAIHASMQEAFVAAKAAAKDATS